MRNSFQNKKSFIVNDNGTPVKIHQLNMAELNQLYMLILNNLQKHNKFNFKNSV